MTFFGKKKIEGLPTERDFDEHEKGQKNLSIMRSIKKEKDYDTSATILNERIQKGENIGSYEEDPLQQELNKIKQEHWELNNREDIRKYKRERNSLDKTKDRIEELKSKIKESLNSEEYTEDSYTSNIENLRGQEGILEYQKERNSMFTEETIAGIERIAETERRMKEIEKELKEKYGNQDLKNVDGTYLN